MAVKSGIMMITCDAERIVRVNIPGTAKEARGSGGRIESGTTSLGPEGVMASSSAAGDDRSGPPIEGDADLVFEVRDVEQLVAELDGPCKTLLERTPLTVRQLKDFRQAVMEMGGNAIEWGCGKGQKPWALVTCRVGPEAVTVTVRDRGPGFDPETRPQEIVDESVKAQTLGPGCIGIMLARGLVGRLLLQRQGERGHPRQAVRAGLPRLASGRSPEKNGGHEKNEGT